ncbi:antigen 5 like allergen Cul n 1-like [Calliphora vicina]|uniref:antigen 5 like allergen Cul n 1-like n=1 Tax=Calliphora vicina TaxID=7373 RepID=UPI00325A7FF0
MKPFSIFVCLVAFIVSSNATDYCSKSICNYVKGVTHIACGNNGKFSQNCEPDAAMVTVTESMKQLLIEGHNEKRNIVAGGGVSHLKPACRMATMQWDDELASVAAYNVKQCKMQHDKCRNTDKFQYSGQNLAVMGFYGEVNNTARITQSIGLWFEEEKYTKQAFIDKYPKNYSGPQIGHFTVMMADRNIRLGCAISTYSVADKPYTSYLLACNYATTNMINFPIYATCDKPATFCKTGTNPKYPNLCSNAESYNVNKWF